jgi:tRNA-uridine 2-sulfurtransferase
MGTVMTVGRITVGLSGGVDSAVAALLLKQQGWAVRGLFMKNWEEDDTPGHCAAAEDLAAARAVADHLGIELATVNFAAEYWERVFEHFLAEYRAGRTPNPDVLCNSEIKFRAFLDHALAQGADAIATGHYAGLAHDSHAVRLLLAADAAKDQTYFLHRLTQRALRQTHFPLGALTKGAVRRMAADAELPNHARRDSTGICFIGERRFRDFLARYLPPQPGVIETADGRVVGQHQGLMYYTVGQRQGLGIGGIQHATEAPWFVVGKDLARNALQVVQGHDHPLLLSQALEAIDWSWVAGIAPNTDIPYQARIRHRHPLQECRLTPLDSGRYRINFTHPQWAVAPGQSAVLYQGDTCLGGGVISIHFHSIQHLE